MRVINSLRSQKRRTRDGQIVRRGKRLYFISKDRRYCARQG